MYISYTLKLFYAKEEGDEMLEGLKNRYKNNYTSRFYLNLILVFIVNVIFFIAYIKGIKIYFSTNDDTAISGLIAGTQGSFPGYAVYINFIPAYILSKLTNIISSINWYGMYLLGTFFVSFTFIGNIFLNKFKLRIGVFVYVVCIICGILPFLSSFTFTFVCYTSILAGVLLIVYGYDINNRNISLFCYVFGALLFINGSFIRYNSLYTGIALLLGYMIFKMFEDKKKSIVFICVSILSITLALGFRVYSRMQYYNDPIWNSYIEFNEARANLIDFGLPDYYENIEFYDSVGWSENDYHIFKSYSFPENEKFSTENLQKIYNYRESINKSNIKVKVIIDKIYGIIKTDISTILCMTFIIMIFIYNIIFTKNKLMSILLFIFPFGMNILFLMMNRAPFRVVYPHYFITLIVLIYLAKDSSDNENINSNYNNIENYFLFAGITLFMIICGLQLFNEYNKALDIRNNEYLNNSIEVYQTLCNDKENVYLTSLDHNGSIVKSKSILREYPQNFKSNLISVGGWLSRSKNFEYIKELYGINNLIYDLTTKDNYYFVDMGTHIGMFTTYFKETYNLDVNFEVVREMYHTKVYKVSVVES